MPEIMPEYDIINQSIEIEVLSAMEEDEAHMTNSSRTKKQDIGVISGSRQSKRIEATKASKHYKVGNASHTTETKKSSLPPALVSPEAQHHKATVSFRNMTFGDGRRSIYTGLTGNHQDLMNLSLPTLQRSPSEHSLMSNVEYHSDDRISFEGQHFHYLDSFVVHDMPEATAPEPMCQAGMPPSRSSSAISLPQLINSISDEDLSYDVCNADAAVSSSSSAESQFTELRKYPVDTVSFNPNTIFSREGERGSWSIDIDQEFRLMEK